MAKIRNYQGFINEGFYRKLNSKKKVSVELDQIVKKILDTLAEYDIHSLDDFISSNKIDRYLIDKIIDQSTNNMRELQEIRFKVRLELSNTNQLREYLKELEEVEDYEKCALIVKKLSS